VDELPISSALIPILVYNNQIIMLYKSKNHSSYSLKYHFIFTVKYRKSLLVGKIGKDIKQFLYDISKKYNFFIIEQESDKNHLHLLIESEPKISPLQIVRMLKQQSTYKIWQYHKLFLLNHFWREYTFWTDGYFVASVGANTIDKVKEYIKNQGK
jgi:putative transposase